jgi:hypothetical protein
VRLLRLLAECLWREWAELAVPRAAIDGLATPEVIYLSAEVGLAFPDWLLDAGVLP